MEALEQDKDSPKDMAQQDKNSESSRLVTQSNTTKPSYLNVVNNLCAVLFLGIIVYCSFVDDKNLFVSLFSFHPSLMALGWLMIMSTAINAITPGDLATEWMPIRLRSARHWVLQVFGGIIIIIGFILIFVHKINIGKEHFQTLHGKFGLSSIIFMITTMLGGLGALYSLKLKQYLAPIYTKLLHATFGLITFVLGVTTIALGLFSIWFSGKGKILQYTSLVLVLLVMLLTVLRPTLKVYFRLRERLENVN